ncbi:MAG: CHAT domain-containing protein, partial [Verrucomicrobiota bacterium]
NISIEVTSAAALDLATLDTSQSDLDTTTSRRGLRNTDDADSGGDVEVTTRGALTVDAIATEGGHITLNSRTSIQATQLDSSSESGSGGAIALNAPTVDVGAIDSSGATNGGNINIPPNDDELLTTIQTGSINSSGGEDGGDIRIAATEILQTDTIDASAGTGTGGDVSLELTVEDLDTTELDDLSGTFQVSSIDTQSMSGNGGNITVDTNILFRTTNTIDGTTSSINATGGDDSGIIRIDHGGGPQDITFDVLAPDTDLINGTTGSIVSGRDEINPTASFAGLFETENDNIIIRTSSATQKCPPVCETPPSPEITPLDEDLISLLEEGFTKQYVDYFGLDDVRIKSLKDARDALQSIEEKTGVRTAVIYAFYVRPEYVTDDPLVDGSTQWYSFGSDLSLEGAAVDQLPWAYSKPSDANDKATENVPLQVVMITPDEYREPIVRRSQTTDTDLQEILGDFRRPLLESGSDFRIAGAQLFCSLLGEVKEDLDVLNIDNLAFIMDEGLRTLPLSAMYIPSECEGFIPGHDSNNISTNNPEQTSNQRSDTLEKRIRDDQGGHYLIERFSVGILPSFSLVDAEYTPLYPESTQLLAMGADFQVDDTNSSRWRNASPPPTLPAVSSELETITNIWSSVDNETDDMETFVFNEDFTLTNLQRQIAILDRKRPAIVHIATHSEFQEGEPSESFIRLWPEEDGVDRLHLDLLPTVVSGSNDLIELLVLSSCETAQGDNNSKAELGFAGFATQAGVKSGLASLWKVNDVSTLALMIGFYHALDVLYGSAQDGQTDSVVLDDNHKIRSEALRRVQVAMLKKEIRFSEEGYLILDAGGALGLDADIIISDELAEPLKKFDSYPDLSEPYHWAAFTIVSSPW